MVKNGNDPGENGPGATNVCSPKKKKKEPFGSFTHNFYMFQKVKGML